MAGETEVINKPQQCSFHGFRSKARKWRHLCLRWFKKFLQIPEIHTYIIHNSQTSQFSKADSSVQECKNSFLDYHMIRLAVYFYSVTQKYNVLFNICFEF